MEQKIRLHIERRPRNRKACWERRFRPEKPELPARSVATASARRGIFLRHALSIERALLPTGRARGPHPRELKVQRVLAHQTKQRRIPWWGVRLRKERRPGRFSNCPWG